MRLDELLNLAGVAASGGRPPSVEIGGLSDDSRRVRAGDLFIARPGPARDGASFARDAIDRGAAAIVAATPIADLGPVLCIVLQDVRDATGRIAHAFYGDPSRSVRVLAVTGTNGKTTTAYLVRHILDRVGIKCGLISTVEIDDGATRVDSEMTTPGAIELAGIMAAMRDNGCAAAAMEASSHALDQRRTSGLRLAAAGFTNLTGDHLDYHATMDDYAAAKARLFESLGQDGVGVVNADDAWSARIARDSVAPIVGYTIDGPADRAAAFRASDIRVNADGSRFALHVPGGQTIEAMLPMVGRHNIQNALTAACMVHRGMGVPIDDVIAALADARGAPGRLQRVVNAAKPGVSILVDYAHTDDALANVLAALRPLTRGKLRVVFGCGGDRDATKRPRMAAVAARLGDAIYVTSDNPRTEDPNRIIEQIVAGVPATARPATIVEPDRRAAIYRSIADAEADDVVLIAGKGHENYQVVGTQRLHFDDAEVATQAT